MRQISEDALVRSARAGSADARGELFRRHGRSAWSRAFAITGRAALADDVVQDAFERAFRSLDSYAPSAPFARWLGRIVANRAIDLLRRERRDAPLGDAADLALEWAGGREEEHALRQRVAGLSPERRVVIVLRYWLDLTPPEIAGMLDLPVGTVHSRLARALADLRDQMVKEHGD